MKRILSLLLLLSTPAFAAKPLTLGEYLSQVESGSPALAAAKLRSESGLLKAEGADVVTFPYLFGTAKTSDDQSEQAFPAFQGSGTKGTTYTAGIGANTPWGLSARYSWNTSYFETAGVAVPTAGRYTSYNNLEFTLNLIKNGFGSQTRANQELARASNTAQSLTGTFQQVSRLAEAENAYWRLALARQAVEIQKDVLARSNKLLEWAKRRVGLQLGDRSDLLQAQAAQEVHNLDYVSLVQDEKDSARAFNLLRNVEGDRVPEAVALPNMEETLRMAAPKKEGERLDVQAAEQRTRAAQAQSQLEKDSLKPSVDIVGNYAWTGREPTRSGAISEATTNKFPNKAIALTFSVPLNAPTWIGALKGANQDIEAAHFEYEQTRLAAAKDWQDLSSRLESAKHRLQLANKVEAVQKDKFEAERQRLQRGRTTTFQALTFEQDYAQAQLLRLRTQAEVLQVLAQMKTYRGNL